MSYAKNYSECRFELPKYKASFETPGEYKERHQKALDEWNANAKDRPLSLEPLGPGPSLRVRLFDGEWFLTNAVPTIIEANYLNHPKGEGIEPNYVRYVALVWETYELLMEQNDLDACRIFAASIYKYLDLQDRAARTLCDAGRVAFERRVENETS